MRRTRTFISFIEEAVLNSNYTGYIAGRIEIDYPDALFPGEIRFLTKNIEEYGKFRDEWDFKEVTQEELTEIRRIVKEKFYEELPK